jgi:restriction endonuclease Mrr
MIIDSIFQNMALENMNGIDDIESILIDGQTLQRVQEEYQIMFEQGGAIAVRELEDYFGAKIELTSEFLPQGFKIKRLED